MHLAQELLTKVQCSGGSRSFAKETSALKMSSAVADHRKLTMTNWEDHQLPILQLHKKLPKNSALTILWSSGIWSKLEMCKSSKSGCLMNWQLIKKSLFWSVVFSYSIQQQTISQVDCDMWRKVYFIQLALASSVVGPRRSSKAFPKAKLGPKKGHGHCLVVCCPSDPLQLSESITIWVKPLHLRSLLSKLIRCTKTDWRLKNKHFKSWTNWATKFYLICHSHLISCQSTITSSSISMSFCRENASTTNRRHKMLSKSSSNPKVWIFMLQE